MTAKAPEPAQTPAASTGTPAPPPAKETPTAATAAVPAQAPAPAPAKASVPAKAPAPVKAKPPAKAKPPKSAAGVAGGAFVVAIVALLVAIGATAVSIYSLKVARDALSKNADHAAASSTPTTQPPAAAAPANTVTSTPTTTASALRVQYFAELVKAELKVPGPTGCNASYVDVDTMAVGSTAGHEFYLSGCVDPLAFRVDRSSGASSSSSNPTPEACGALASGTSGTQELVLPVRSGLTFCLLTNRTDATAQNLPQRLAIVEVRDVASDKTVTIAVSTYRIL